MIRLDVAQTKNLTLFLQWLQHASVLVKDLKNFNNGVGSTSTTHTIVKIFEICSLDQCSTAPDEKRNEIQYLH